MEITALLLSKRLWVILHAVANGLAIISQPLGFLPMILLLASLGVKSYVKCSLTFMSFIQNRMNLPLGFVYCFCCSWSGYSLSSSLAAVFSLFPFSVAFSCHSNEVFSRWHLPTPSKSHLRHLGCTFPKWMPNVQVQILHSGYTQLKNTRNITPVIVKRLVRTTEEVLGSLLMRTKDEVSGSLLMRTMNGFPLISVFLLL